MYWLLTWMAIWFFFDLWSGSTRRLLRILSSLEHAPRNQKAVWYKRAALILFFICAGLIVIGSSAELWEHRILSEVIGSSGLFVGFLALVCAMQYANVNGIIEE